MKKLAKVENRVDKPKQTFKPGIRKPGTFMLNGLYEKDITMKLNSRSGMTVDQTRVIQ